MVDLYAEVVPKVPGNWNGDATVTPLPQGNSVELPMKSVSPGVEQVSRSSKPTHEGGVLVIGTPPGNSIVLPLIISADDVVSVYVGIYPYDDGVVVLFV